MRIAADRWRWRKMSPLVRAEGPAPSSSGMETEESVSVDLQTVRVGSGAL